MKRTEKPERITVRERFAKEWGMSADEVKRLVLLAERAFKANEHACNGDPLDLTFNTPAKDKSEASRRWGARVDEVTEIIRKLVAPFGFTDVVYTGLGPTLKRGEQFVEVPY